MPERAAPSNRISAYILFFVIAAAPLPFGSSDPTTVALWSFILGLGLLVASPRLLRGGHLAILAGLGLIIACYGFVLHEQLSDNPWIAKPNPIWAKTAALLGRPLQPSVSIVRDEAFYALGSPLAALLALILGLVVGAERSSGRQAILVMAWAGVAYAVYGILSLLFTPHTILWREKTAYIGNLTATFINRNTAATYFGSCAAVWLVLLMEAVRGRLPRGPIAWRKIPYYVLRDASTTIVIRSAMFFICVAALFMTASRGGTIFSMLAFATAFMIYFRRDLPRGKGLILVLFAVAAVAMVLLQFMAGNVVYRMDAHDLASEGRLAGYSSTLRIIADNPWFGTGLGTFVWAFPPYRSNASMYGVWDIAHSTPLELAAELGIPLTVIILLAWFVSLIILARGLRGSRRNFAIPLAALSVSLIALLHSSIDFSLQISGYAIVVFALVGVGLAQSFSDEKATSSDGKRRRRSKADKSEETM